MSQNNAYLQLLPLGYRSIFYKKTNMSLKGLLGWVVEKTSHLTLVYNFYKRSVLFSFLASVVEIKLLAQQGKESLNRSKSQFSLKKLFKQIYKNIFYNSLGRCRDILSSSSPETLSTKSSFWKPPICSERPRAPLNMNDGKTLYLMSSVGHRPSYEPDFP